ARPPVATDGLGGLVRPPGRVAAHRDLAGRRETAAALRPARGAERGLVMLAGLVAAAVTGVERGLVMLAGLVAAAATGAEQDRAASRPVGALWAEMAHRLVGGATAEALAEVRLVLQLLRRLAVTPGIVAACAAVHEASSSVTAARFGGCAPTTSRADAVGAQSAVALRVERRATPLTEGVLAGREAAVPSEREAVVPAAVPGRATASRGTGLVGQSVVVAMGRAGSEPVVAAASHHAVLSGR
ncbi:MAG: hypothetical protein RLY45_2280, partial [Actinomycetota bacterium]